MDAEAELYIQILTALEIDHQFVAHFDPSQVEEIKLTRTLSRRAGRELGWKVRTIETDAQRRADGKVVVVVVVVESTPEEEARMEERGNFIIRNMNRFED